MNFIPTENGACTVSVVGEKPTASSMWTICSWSRAKHRRTTTFCVTVSQGTVLCVIEIQNFLHPKAQPSTPVYVRFPNFSHRTNIHPTGDWACPGPRFVLGLIRSSVKSITTNPKFQCVPSWDAILILCIESLGQLCPLPSPRHGRISWVGFRTPPVL